jgi:imidazolonepropionase-like amidohydrolase
MAQRERRALERAERRHRRGHRLLDLRACREPLRIRRVDFGLVGGVERIRAGVVVARPARSDEIHGAVGDDAMEPGGEMGPGLEASELAIGPDEAFLDDVFRVLFVAGHPVGELKGPPAMAFNEDLKRLAVSLSGPRKHGRDFGPVHSDSLDGNPWETVRFQRFQGFQRFEVHGLTDEIGGASKQMVVRVKNTAIGAILVCAGAALATAQLNPRSTLVRDVRVFDGERVVEHRNVLIAEGKIAAVGSADAPTPAGAESIDGRGRTLLPGLIDAHVHLPIFGAHEALEQPLAFGVTTVVVMGTPPPPPGFTGKTALTLMKELASTDPPDIADLQTAGTVATAKDGHPYQMDGGRGSAGAPTINAPNDAAAFVAARVAEGSDFIKIIYDDTSASYGRKLPTLNEATIAALASAAHGQARLAVAHIGTEGQAMGAINAGVDGLAHLFVGPTVSDEFVQLAARRGVFVIPTLSVLYSVCGHSDGQQILDDVRMMARVRSQFRAPLSWPAGGITPSCDGAKAAVRRLSEARVPIVAGTDAPGAGTTYGASLHWELQHLVDAGMNPTAALASATSVAARAFRMTDRGRIQPGMRADLLLVDGDPTTDIRATRNIVRIWKKGVGRD